MHPISNVHSPERRFGSGVHMHPLFKIQFKHILNWQKKNVAWTSSQPIRHPSCFTKN
jgi:hypothetical protein